MQEAYCFYTAAEPINSANGQMSPIIRPEIMGKIFQKKTGISKGGKNPGHRYRLIPFPSRVLDAFRLPVIGFYHDRVGDPVENPEFCRGIASHRFRQSRARTSRNAFPILSMAASPPVDPRPVAVHDPDVHHHLADRLPLVAPRKWSSTGRKRARMETDIEEPPVQDFPKGMNRPKDNRIQQYSGEGERG